MKWLAIIVVMFWFSCGSGSSVQDKNNLYGRDSLLSKKSPLEERIDSSAKSILPNPSQGPRMKVFLPGKRLKKSEILQKVKEIDTLKNGNSGQWKFSELIEGCVVEKYFLDGHLRYLRYGCGDCSPSLREEEYYFDRNELVYVKTYTIKYGYPPCWSEKEYAENNMSESYRKKNMKEWTEQYWIVDSLNFSLKRQGDFHDTAYVSEHPMVMKDLRESAEDYLNTPTVK